MATSESKLIHAERKDVELGMVQKVIEELKSAQCNKERFYKSLLKIYFLILANPKVLTTDVIEFLHILQKQNEHSHISVQIVLSTLFSIYEEQTAIAQVKPFKYLPFQRALPFFPDHGHHVTIEFPNETLTQSLQKQCILLFKQMSGRYTFLSFFF